MEKKIIVLAGAFTQSWYFSIQKVSEVDSDFK